jgi:hypothetical protein
MSPQRLQTASIELSLGREWRLMSYLSEHGFKSHASPLSFKIEFTPDQQQQRGKVLFQ